MLLVQVVEVKVVGKEEVKQLEWTRVRRQGRCRRILRVREKLVVVVLLLVQVRVILAHSRLVTERDLLLLFSNLSMRTIQNK